jgi:hypothetical protein
MQGMHRLTFFDIQWFVAKIGFLREQHILDTNAGTHLP